MAVQIPHFFSEHQTQYVLAQCCSSLFIGTLLGVDIFLNFSVLLYFLMSAIKSSSLYLNLQFRLIDLDITWQTARYVKRILEEKPFYLNGQLV